MLRTWGNDCKRSLICVDSYENGVLKGHFCQLGGECKAFESLSQFLIKMERSLEESGQPQAYTTARSFGKPRQAENEETVSSRGRGKLGTFEIQILFRQHSSWQGLLHWVETGQEQSFRSVLELVYLLDSALGDLEK